MTSIANKMLIAEEKRCAILKKSLDKKRKALQTQEGVFANQSQIDVENHPTYQYYQKELENAKTAYEKKCHYYQMELEAAEMAYQKKCRYYNDAIDALNAKLNIGKPTNKVYQRLLVEVEMEQKEYDELSKQIAASRDIVQEKSYAIMQAEHAAHIKEEQDKERREKEAALEKCRIAKEAEKAAEEQRAKERMEEAKKLYADEIAALKNAPATNESATTKKSWKEIFAAIKTYDEFKALDVPYADLTEEEMILHDNLEDRLMKEAESTDSFDDSPPKGISLTTKESPAVKETTASTKKATFAPDPLDYLMSITSYDGFMTKDACDAIAALTPQQMPKYIAYMGTLATQKNTIVQTHNPSGVRPFVAAAPLVPPQEVPGPLGHATLLQSTKPKMMPKQVARR